MENWQNLPIWENVNIKVLKPCIDEDNWKYVDNIIRQNKNFSIRDLFYYQNKKARNLLIPVVEQYKNKIISDWHYHNDAIFIPRTYNESLSLPQLFQSVI